MPRGAARVVDFDSPIPPEHVIYAVEYTGCAKGSLRLWLVHILDSNLLDGCHADAWWRIDSPGLPDRLVRLSRGGKSLRRLVSRYGLLDAHGCINVQRGCYSVAPVAQLQDTLAATDQGRHLDATVPDAIRDTMGVPQRTEDSGICWYAALCFCMFFNESMRDLIVAHMPEDLRPTCTRALRAPSASEELRRALWERYAFGDEYGQAPELDGQNGVSQFCILAAQLGIAVERYFVDADGASHLNDDQVIDQRGGAHVLRGEPQPGVAHVCVFRFRRGAHGTKARHRPSRRIRLHGRRYRLVGMMIGSEHCGHQIAAAAHTDRGRGWAVCDSDAQRYGIGPIHVSSCERDRDRWWKAWRSLVPVTFFSEGMCDLSPQNRRVGDLVNPHTGRAQPARADASPDAGLTNVDFIFISRPDGS